MNDKIKKLLKGAGFSDEVISLVEKDDKDFDVQKAVESNNEAQKEHYKSLLENEIADGIRDEALQATEGKIYKLLNHELKKYGVPISPEDESPLKEKIKKAADHIKAEAEKSAGKTNEDFKALQEENLTLKNQLTEKEEAFESRVKEVETKFQTERKAEKIDSQLQKRFTNVPAKKLLGGEHNEGYYHGLRTFIEKNYDIDYDKDEVVFFPKGVKTRATVKNAEGKEVFKTADDVILEGLKTYKWLVESNGQGGEGEKDKNEGGGNGSEGAKGERYQQLQKKIAEQSA